MTLFIYLFIYLLLLLFCEHDIFLKSILSFQKIKFYKFHYLSFCFINLFFFILDLISKMSTKVQFIKKVHNKIQIDQIFYLKTLKRSKKKNKIRIDKNIERVQDKQPKKKKKKKIIK